MVVESWLGRAVARTPERTAIETPAGCWSYRELAIVVRDGAAWLADRGVRRGDRVAIALPAGLAFAQALHACFALGAVAVPVDLRLSAGERAAVTEGVAAVVDTPLWEGPGTDRVVSESGHDLDAAAVVIHTSGTTAAPRPVVLSYANLLWSALAGAVALGHDPRERWLCAMPLSHVGGLSILVRSAIFATTAVVHERFETEPVLAALTSRGGRPAMA